MLEPELFALLEQTADAAYTVAEDGRICSWNAAAGRLFGYQASEVLQRHVEEVLDAYDGLGTEPLAGGSQASVRQWDNTDGGIPNFDLDVRTASGSRIWINVSTIIFDNRRTRPPAVCAPRARYQPAAPQRRVAPPRAGGRPATRGPGRR